MSIKNYNNGNGAGDDQEGQEMRNSDEQGCEDLEQPSTSKETKETDTAVKRKCEVTEPDDSSDSEEPAKRKCLELPDLIKMDVEENVAPVIPEAVDEGDLPDIVDPGPMVEPDIIPAPAPFVEENANNDDVVQAPMENQEPDVPVVIEPNPPEDEQDINKIIITISDEDEEDEPSPPPFFLNHPGPDNWVPPENVEQQVPAQNPLVPVRMFNLFERRMNYDEMYRRYHIFRGHQQRVVDAAAAAANQPPAVVEEVQPEEADGEEPLIIVYGHPPLHELGPHAAQVAGDPDAPLNVDEQQLANLEDQPPPLDIDIERLPPIIGSCQPLVMHEPALNLEVPNLEGERSSADVEQEEPLVIFYGGGQPPSAGFSQALLNVDECPSQVTDDDQGLVREGSHHPSVIVDDCKPSTSRLHQSISQGGGPIRLVSLQNLMKPAPAVSPKSLEESDSTDLCNDENKGEGENPDNSAEAPPANEDEVENPESNVEAPPANEDEAENPDNSVEASPANKDELENPDCSVKAPSANESDSQIN